MTSKSIQKIGINPVENVISSIPSGGGYGLISRIVIKSAKVWLIFNKNKVNAKGHDPIPSPPTGDESPAGEEAGFKTQLDAGLFLKALLLLARMGFCYSRDMNAE
jgi:hypothetical protein